MKYKVLKNTIGFLLLCLMTLSSAVFADYKKGLSAHNKGNYSLAFREYKSAAEDGSAPAQHSLGILYAQGKGVTKDVKKAYEWFEKAALNNHPPSQYNMGMAYFRGKYHYKDTSLAEKWLAKAAKRGHPSAQLNLGNMYVLEEPMISVKLEVSFPHLKWGLTRMIFMDLTMLKMLQIYSKLWEWN